VADLGSFQAMVLSHVPSLEMVALHPN
jgi:hypothetical protein